MHLHDTHLSSFLIHVFVEGDQPWFVGFDEVDQTGNTQSLGLELSGLESVRRYEYERSRHRARLLGSPTRRQSRRHSSGGQRGVIGMQISLSNSPVFWSKLASIG